MNTGGVIPVIFASSILALPATIASAFEGRWVASLQQQLSFGMPLYLLLYAAGIILFAYFYTAIIFNPDDVAENLRKYGAFIPGIRPGRPTAGYIDAVLVRITPAGAAYLAVIALVPGFLTSDGHLVFAGTWLLILVGVTLDTVQQVESRLIMRPPPPPPPALSAAAVA